MALFAAAARSFSPAIPLVSWPGLLGEAFSGYSLSPDHGKSNGTGKGMALLFRLRAKRKRATCYKNPAAIAIFS
jgi:hypothetical protein